MAAVSVRCARLGSKAKIRSLRERGASLSKISIPDPIYQSVHNALHSSSRQKCRTEARCCIGEGARASRPPDDDALTIAFEVSTRDRANCWMRVRYTITNRWSGKRSDIDDEIPLVTVR